MNFALTSEQSAILAMAQTFGQAEIAPHARVWETTGDVPPAFWGKAAALGMGGVYADPDHGGSGLTRADGVLLFEGLGMACPAVAAWLSIHNMVAAMIDRHGTAAQRADWLPKVCSLDCLLAYALTEPGAGSDAAALVTRAERVAGGWRLTGEKAFISGAGVAGAYLVMARTGGPGAAGITAFLLPAGTPGLSFGAPEDKMGWRAQPTRAVRMDGCILPPDALLGAEGRGFAIAMAGLDGGRLNIAATALGGAQAAFDATRAYMADRRAFGQTLDRFQALQFRLAEMEVALQAARVFLRQAAWLLDAGDAMATVHCAMAKLHVTDAAFGVANGCLQLHGGYGYLADYGIEKIVRDLRVHQILEGTNEIMRMIIARSLLA